MRRLLFLGVALTASFAVGSLLRAEVQPINSGEKAKLRKVLENYFDEPDPTNRDATILRQIDAVVGGLDSKRARTRKGSLLADVAGLRDLIWECHSFASPSKRGLRRITWESPIAGEKVRFHLSVPRRYNPKNPAPLVIALHPKAIGAEDYLERSFLKTKLKAWQNEFILVTPEWPDPKKDTWGTASIEGCSRLLVPLIYVFRELFVDPDRIYVVGEEEGAKAALDLASAFADRLAGAFVVGGGGHEKDPNLGHLTVKRLDVGDPDLAAPYAEILAALEADDGLRRDPFPAKIDWRFFDIKQERAYWMLITRERKLAPGVAGSIKAEIKAGNIIEVTTEGVDGFRIFLNDLLVDLDADVQVIVNGVKQEVWKPERALGPAIDWMMLTGDLGWLFLASQEFSVPLENVEKEGEDKPK